MHDFLTLKITEKYVTILRPLPKNVLVNESGGQISKNQLHKNGTVTFLCEIASLNKEEKSLIMKKRG